MGDDLCVAEVRAWAEGLAEVQRFHATGMEAWFNLPGQGVKPPPRWKMMIVTFIAVYPLSLLFTAYLAGHLVDYPAPLRALVFPVLLIPLLTYLLMPRLSRLLHHWLYPTR